MSNFTKKNIFFLHRLDNFPAIVTQFTRTDETFWLTFKLKRLAVRRKVFKSTLKLVILIPLCERMQRSCPAFHIINFFTLFPLLVHFENIESTCMSFLFSCAPNIFSYESIIWLFWMLDRYLDRLAQID